MNPVLYELDQTYVADWLDFLASLGDESIDLVCTDPAYESLMRWKGVGTTARMGFGRKDSASHDPKKFFPVISNKDIPTLLRQIWRVLKNERHAYVMCDFETLLIIIGALLNDPEIFPQIKQGRRLSNPFKPLIWSPGEEAEPGVDIDDIVRVVVHWLMNHSVAINGHNGNGHNGNGHNGNGHNGNGKGADASYPELAMNLIEQIAGLWTDKGMPGCSPMIWDKVATGMGYTYRATHEYILMLWKGKKRRLNNLSIQDVLRVKRVPSTKADVPTQKPVELFEVLIGQSTQPGEVVLDPFMGGGLQRRRVGHWAGTGLDAI